MVNGYSVKYVGETNCIPCKQIDGMKILKVMDNIMNHINK